MRIVSRVVALVALSALAACNSSSGGNSEPTTDAIIGKWTLQTYNGGTLPFVGSLNANGSVNRVDSGSITFDTGRTYLLDIRIVNTLGSTTTPQDFNEVGSFSGTAATGLVLKPNDISGGTSSAQFNQVPATISGNTLSFSQQGKLLTFVKR
jgi:hypothetical protein